MRVWEWVIRIVVGIGIFGGMVWYVLLPWSEEEMKGYAEMAARRCYGFEVGKDTGKIKVVKRTKDEVVYRLVEAGECLEVRVPRRVDWGRGWEGVEDFLGLDRSVLCRRIQRCGGSEGWRDGEQ